MDKKIKDILSHKVLILLLSVLLLAFGVYSYIQITKQEMPDIEAIYGFVQITAPGMSPEEIKTNVAEPVHDVINEYSNVKGYTTTLMDNVCIIFIEMNLDDTESQETLEEIKTKVLYLELPENVTDINFITDIKESQAIYAVHSSSLNELELKNIAQSLSEEISTVTNVMRVNVDSAYSQEIVVNVDYKLLNDLPLTMMDVYNIILANAAEIPLGITEFNGESSSIIVNSNFDSLQSIEDIVLFSNEYATYKLSDIAEVSLENTDNKKTYEFDSEPAAFVEVFFLENIDFTVIGDELQSTVDKFSASLGEDVQITAMTFSPNYVKEQVNQVIINLAECIAIVMLVVLVGLGLRNAIAIAITIPVIVMTTVTVLYLLGQKLELISIAGLIVSIGILVDNSIVISDAAQHYIDMGFKKNVSCHKAVKDNAIPVLSSTLTTVAAFVPLLTLPGIAGDVAFSLPLTVLTAIALSYVVAMTLTPTLAKILFKKRKMSSPRHTTKNRTLEKIFKFMFKLSVFPVVIAFGVLALLSYLVIDKLNIDILPKTEASIVYVDYTYQESDNEQSYEFAKEIEKVVSEQPDVKNYAFSQGGDLPKFYITLGSVSTLPENGRFFIEYDCDTQDLVDYMGMLETDLEPLLEKGEISVNRLELSQPSAPVQIILTSQDYDNLINLSNNIYAEVSQLDSFKDGQLNAPELKTDLVLKLDKDSLALNQLTTIEVQQQISTSVNGLKSPLYKEDDSQLNVKVKTSVENYDDILNLNIKNSQGTAVKLSDIAHFEEIQKLEYISQYNGVPSVTIDAYMAEGYSTYDLENDIMKAIEKHDDGSIKIYKRGDNELTNQILGSIFVAFIIALIVIYLIMYFQFKSFVQPLIILMSIPLSFIGSLSALLAMNESITLTALLGLVSLVGIVVNNGILLVEYINRSVKEGNSVEDSCVLSVSRRLRPILLASLTTILGIVPLALFGGDFFRPLAVTFMGGMLTSALLVLFIIPQLYYITKRNKKQAEEPED
ncbi:MAG: efflux RND transporter permease subunit [Clostridia bacterium]|nr:efflux RND transporter permease subunit [Clostridia bacterium]